MSRSRALAESIVHRYLALVRHQRRKSEQVRMAVNISGKQLSVLRYLVQEGPQSVGRISHHLYVRDATTSALLDRMERDGYVTRRRSTQDCRKVLVEPTEKGRQIAATAPLGMIWLLRTRLPELAPEEIEAIDRALSRLSEIADVDELELT
jgi:DNA-binding MarR family transcriptional regulator